MSRSGLLDLDAVYAQIVAGCEAANDEAEAAGHGRPFGTPTYPVEVRTEFNLKSRRSDDMARKQARKISAATRERQRHTKTREMLWDRINQRLRSLYGHCDRKSVGAAGIEEVLNLINVLRATGAK